MVGYENTKHPVLKDLRRDVFYGGSVWVARDASGLPLSVHCTKLGKRRKNLWEPYANWYTAYTLSDARRQGLATQLYNAMECAALEVGCRRVKSLAGSAAGLALHLSLKHQCWGKTANNEVWVDSALPEHAHLYRGLTPPQAPGPRMLAPELKQLIKTGLRYDHGT
jgi:GNAT superfamily N-acetyltransferase